MQSISHPNQDKIAEILSSAKPNDNLMAKAEEAKRYDIAGQLKKEQQLYEQLQNPVTQEPITNIRELNELIHTLDSSEDYKFNVLLPNAPGGVEEFLSHTYNLRLVETTKLSEEEQRAIKDYIEQNLAASAIDLLKENSFNFIESNKNTILDAIITAMGYINIQNGDFNIFGSGGEYKRARRDYLGINTNIPITPNNEPVGNIRFAYNILKKKEGGLSIKLDYSVDGITPDFKIEGDLNKLTEGTLKALINWAKNQRDENGNIVSILDASRLKKTPLNPGGGTKAPGSVSSEQWKKDVYNAINKCIGIKYRQLMELEHSEVESLFNKYHIGEEIALGRQLVNLRGFLGELRGILIFDAICPKARSYLTGTAKVDLATKLSRKGQSAPADLLVDLLNGIKIGIQIKNTSDLESYAWGNYRNEKGMPVTSFYAERLQTDITDEERDLFGAYVYNQPINDSTYEELYKSFQNKFELFYEVYKKLALYIIRQTTKVVNSNNNLLNGTLTNDFFIMNDSLIPTSALYKAMNEGTDLITSSFKFSTTSKGYYEPESPIPSNYMNYAPQLTMKYSVELQYSKLLQSAYNMS